MKNNETNENSTLTKNNIITISAIGIPIVVGFIAAVKYWYNKYWKQQSHSSEQDTSTEEHEPLMGRNSSEYPQYSTNQDNTNANHQSFSQQNNDNVQHNANSKQHQSSSSDFQSQYSSNGPIVLVQQPTTNNIITYNNNSLTVNLSPGKVIILNRIEHLERENALKQTMIQNLTERFNAETKRTDELRQTVEKNTHVFEKHLAICLHLITRGFMRQDEHLSEFMARFYQLDEKTQQEILKEHKYSDLIEIAGLTKGMILCETNISEALNSTAQAIGGFGKNAELELVSMDETSLTGESTYH